MSNERLRQALQEANLQPDEFAELVGADPKSVRRWLTGQTTPTARSRAQTVHTLRAHAGVEITEHDLWPETAAPPAGDDSRDLVAIYARSDDVRAPDWRTLLQAAQESIDLVGMTLTDTITTAGITDLLIDKARDAVEIRIILAHPESIALTLLADQTGQTERDQDGLTPIDRDLALTRDYITRLKAQPHIQRLAHWAAPGPTILRGDDDMLVSIRLATPSETTRPLMHLRQRHQDGLFAQHLAYVDATASHSETVT